MDKKCLYVAWLIAFISLVVSLASSMLHQLPVCPLCWYQRICLYPLAVILGIAVYRSDHTVIYYALPLNVLGFFFAAYQYLEQMIPGWGPLHLCNSDNFAAYYGNLCNKTDFKWLGFITYPFFSMSATVIISFLLWRTWIKNSRMA